MAISKIKVGNTEHELQTTIANVSGLQTALDAKANKTDIPTVTEFSADADCPNGSVYIGTKKRVLIQGTGNAQVTTNIDGSTISVYVPTSTSSVPTATASTAGAVKVSSVNSSAVTVNSESTTAGRYYPVELNSDGKAIVNVPWTDNNTDTKVSSVSTTTSAEYPLLMKYSTGTTTTAASARFNTAITANPSTGVITATAFNGSAASVAKGYLTYKTSSASGATVELTTGKAYCISFTYSNVMYTVTLLPHSTVAACTSSSSGGNYCRYATSTQKLTFHNSSGSTLTVTAYYIREL